MIDLLKQITNDELDFCFNMSEVLPDFYESKDEEIRRIEKAKNIADELEILKEKKQSDELEKADTDKKIIKLVSELAELKPNKTQDITVKCSMSHMTMIEWERWKQFPVTSPADILESDALFRTFMRSYNQVKISMGNMDDPTSFKPVDNSRTTFDRKYYFLSAVHEAVQGRIEGLKKK